MNFHVSAAKYQPKFFGFHNLLLQVNVRSKCFLLISITKNNGRKTLEVVNFKSNLYKLQNLTL